MASRTGGAYVNGRYVQGGKGGGKGKNARKDTPGDGQEKDKWERKAGDEDTTLERRFNIDILLPGETRQGYLFNIKATRHYDESGRALAGALLYFLARDGRTFRCTFLHRPYFFVLLKTREGLEQMREILAQRFEPEGVVAELVEREDLSMKDHIVGRKQKLIKLSFNNQEGHGKAFRDLLKEIRYRRTDDETTFRSPQKKHQGERSALDAIEEIFEYDVPYASRVCIDNFINCGRWFEVTRRMNATSADDIWDSQCIVKGLDKVAKPGLRIFAWDIECTKEPLKFPDSDRDQITLISIMVDGTGFLIVNRSEVSQDIQPLEYTPLPEFEGVFQTFNEPDEAALLRRFFTLIRDTNPHVMVSFNGDFFDYPFVINRAKVYNMDWNEESGIHKKQGEEYYVGKWIVHLDCFCWVQRDSYLPCGERGLKAVTRKKLKYDPVELDPEDMTPFAKERPQELAAYSVSDAVGTYYLYQKYIHDFIFALCSIIPYGPDDVLRKGSGTLCESLLMAQAFKVQVLFPNKHMDPPLEFHEGTNRLVESSTYEGGRVECMRVGIFRADIKETFQIEPSAVTALIKDLKPMVDFFIEKEEKAKVEDVANYDEVLATIEQALRELCDPDKVSSQLAREKSAKASQSTSPQKGSPTKAQPQEGDYTLKLVEYEVMDGQASVKVGGRKVKKASFRVVKEDFPLIYHLDVGAMYPNIILSNRLQPGAIVSKEFCSACSYNDPENNCKREMRWMWRGDLYMATRGDVKSLTNEMENDSRKYNHKDKDSGLTTRVPWSELTEGERTQEIIKSARGYSQKAYGRLKSSVFEEKKDIVCQRENPFYVDTVRMFRDRRYEFKGLVKKWTKNLEAAKERGDLQEVASAKDMVLLYDSLQMAHKCILNSFYGYVMRKGARWHSMEMAAIVTFNGSNLIREAREFCEHIGLPIELDTDGIWCMLPKSFPDKVKLKLKSGKELCMAYPNTILNYRVHQKYTNHQYQDRDKETGEWKTHSENSIFFEIDGPYAAMLLPASQEEDKMLKKRYVVFEDGGKIAELKGFEVKRRGELKLIQVFQQEVFPVYLKGSTKEEVYQHVGAMANRWLDVIESKGKGMTDDEVIHFFSESKTMSKSVEESGSYKSVQVTTAKRLADMLNISSMLKARSVSCHLFIANKPVGASTTERAIPVKVFMADDETKKVWLRRWLQDAALSDFDMRNIIDWDYYRERLCAVFQKIIVIPAAHQRIANPCPRVKAPEWLRKRVAEQNDRYQQCSLGLWLRKGAGAVGGDDDDDGFEAAKRKLIDMEDLAGGPVPAPTGSRGQWRQSVFDDNAPWATLPSEVLKSCWHIVSIEPASAVKADSAMKVGDPVLVHPDIEDTEMLGELERDPHVPKMGSIVSFVSGFIRVIFPNAEEQLVKSDLVTPVKEEGLFVIWVATGSPPHLHRCEVLMKRRIVLALESDFCPEASRCNVYPPDLRKGLRVWPREPSERRQGPGVLTSADPQLGLCQVTWATGAEEVVFAADLERQFGSATKVLREAPRNMQHPCLVELEMPEEDFQKQRGEGTFGERDSSWPRVDAIYEASQPLEYDLLCRSGPTVVLASPERVQEARARSSLRLQAEELQLQPYTDYLKAMEPSRNIYFMFCFDVNRPSRAFCALYAPGLKEACACFCGIDQAEGEKMRPSLESALSQELTHSLLEMGVSEEEKGAVRAEVVFLAAKSMSSLILWGDQRLQELKKREPGGMCILASQLPLGQLRGLAPSLLVDINALRHLVALRETPLCRARLAEEDSHFPALDWQRWILVRFATKAPRLKIWWQIRLAMCRTAGISVCNLPDTPAAMVPAALDLLYGRQLMKENQLRWASTGTRPDFGGGSMETGDAQEESVESINWLLQGKDLSRGRDGERNRPGIYRSVCIDVNLKTKICACALQHARYISDQEGGELSKKMLRKAGNSEALGKFLDPTSEASVGSFEALVNMVQDIVATRDLRVRDFIKLKKTWAAQSPEAKARLKEAGLQLESVSNILAVATSEDQQFLDIMDTCSLANSRLKERLQELRCDLMASNNLLDGLYSWLASPHSLLHDPALVRKVHLYMDRVLQLLVEVLKKSGCTVIHASYSRVIFATGKLRPVPDVSTFWEAFVRNLKSHRVLEAVDIGSGAAQMYYGLMWLDPTNSACLMIDEDTGEVKWKVEDKWAIADGLPPAVRPYIHSYTADLLLKPQQELGRRMGLFLNQGLKNEKKVSECGMDDPMEVDQGGVECDDDEVDEEGGCRQADAMVTEEASGARADGPSAGGPLQEGVEKVAERNAQVLEDLRTYIREEYFDDLRRQVLKFLERLEGRRQKELASTAARPSRRQSRKLAAIEEGSFVLSASESDSGQEEDDLGDEAPEEEEGPQQAERKARQRRQQVLARWSFPEMAGRQAAPGNLRLEFTRTLTELLQLEECIGEQVEALRDRMCQKAGISSFQVDLTKSSTFFPLVLREVCCRWCNVTSTIDVTSHPSFAPGEWVCTNCDRSYDKLTVEARLVTLLDNTIQAWQAQEVNCKRCKKLRSTHLQQFCHCFGEFQARFEADDFYMILRVLKSLVKPHDLKWLGEVLDSYSTTLK